MKKVRIVSLYLADFISQNCDFMSRNCDFISRNSECITRNCNLYLRIPIYVSDINSEFRGLNSRLQEKSFYHAVVTL